MSLLRASGEVAGLQVDIDAAVDPEGTSDAGVPHGSLLLEFASAAQLDAGNLSDARVALHAALGADAVVEAAATVAIFNGLVRVADGTGIQLDQGVMADSADYRDRLGVNGYGGSANVDVHVASGRASSVADLFG